MRGSALIPVSFGTFAGTLAVAGRALGNALVREATAARLVGTFSMSQLWFHSIAWGYGQAQATCGAHLRSQLRHLELNR